MGAEPRLVLDAFLPYRLSVAANSVSQVIARAYEAEGLKTNEWRLIAVLAEESELTQQQLVGRTRMDKVSVSRAAQGLAARGLVRRRADREDARSLLLSLTAAGRRLHARLAPVVLRLEAEILEGFDPAEIARLEEALRRVEVAAARLLAGG